MNFNRLIHIFTVAVVLSGPPAAAQTFELVRFDTEDGGKIEASLFAADRSKAVIFAHGAIFDKESWYALAREFQHRGMTALPIDFRGYGNSAAGSSTEKLYDILAAIAYLKAQGFTQINIVGASMGGAAVLRALDRNTSPVHKVILLAPAGGPPISSSAIEKLFVVSRNEGLFSSVQSIYAASAEPKRIHVYPGNTHAQHLFKTDVGEELTELIINSIIDNEQD